MATGRQRPYLVCYDIADPRRLVRVHRRLRQVAVPLQYSVFMLVANEAAIDELVQALEQLVDNDADDIRIYPLPQRLSYIHLGRQLLPEGVILADDLLPSSLFGKGESPADAAGSRAID